MEWIFGRPTNCRASGVELSAMTWTREDLPVGNPIDYAAKMRTQQRECPHLISVVYYDPRDLSVRKSL